MDITRGIVSKQVFFFATTLTMSSNYGSEIVRFPWENSCLTAAINNHSNFESHIYEFKCSTCQHHTTGFSGVCFLPKQSSSLFLHRGLTAAMLGCLHKQSVPLLDGLVLNHQYLTWKLVTKMGHRRLWNVHPNRKKARGKAVLPSQTYF